MMQIYQESALKYLDKLMNVLLCVVLNSWELVGITLKKIRGNYGSVSEGWLSYGDCLGTMHALI